MPVMHKTTQDSRYSIPFTIPVLKEEIDFLDEHYLLNLITQEGTVKGATLLDIRTGEVKQINAKSVIIATGGYGSIYHGYTTNAYGSTGDGVAAVLRAGGAVSDMEFVQFHPTALKGSSILISESARGEGGYLINTKGERFVDELKPRDVVARAILQSFKKEKRSFWMYVIWRRKTHGTSPSGSRAL